MMNRGWFHYFLICIVSVLYSCGNPSNESDNVDSNEIVNPTNEVILSSEIVWQKLNPARGDLSPQAGTIWGDRNGMVQTGFLAKFVDGFSSPPHIHNVTYRAVVIEGLVHNDDPDAEVMWMKPGSFWTQPAGESHITSANGKEVMALVEIDKGPYLLKPIDQSFDNGERAINIDASNLVWLKSDRTNLIAKESRAELSFLLESKGEMGFKSLFIKLPSKCESLIEANGSVFHSVIVKGELDYRMPENKDLKVLDPGSYFGSSDNSIHTIANNSDLEVILYVRTNGDIRIR